VTIKSELESALRKYIPDISWDPFFSYIRYEILNIPRDDSVSMILCISLPFDRNERCTLRHINTSKDINLDTDVGCTLFSPVSEDISLRWFLVIAITRAALEYIRKHVGPLHAHFKAYVMVAIILHKYGERIDEFLFMDVDEIPIGDEEDLFSLWTLAESSIDDQISRLVGIDAQVEEVKESVAHDIHRITFRHLDTPQISATLAEALACRWGGQWVLRDEDGISVTWNQRHLCFLDIGDEYVKISRSHEMFQRMRLAWDLLDK